MGFNFSILKAASKEKIVAAFKKFDKNGDGVIDWEEFQQVRKILSMYLFMS